MHTNLENHTKTTRNKPEKHVYKTREIANGITSESERMWTVWPCSRLTSECETAASAPKFRHFLLPAAEIVH